MKIIIAALLGCTLLADAAWAGPVDDLLASTVGTIQVTAEPYMAGGKLIGCQYVFKTLTQDWVYSKGQYLKVDGSISIVSSNGNLGATLKVVVNEISLAPDGSLVFKPSAPSRAYLLGDDYETNLGALVAASGSDTPGALFSIFDIEKTLPILSSASQTEHITVAFNRNNGPSDVLLPIELDVRDVDTNGKRTRSQENGLNFAKCTLALLKDQ